MRAIIFILHLVLAYMLLSGWPDSFPVWLRAGLALIVIMLALPMTDIAGRRTDRVKLISVRAPKWLDYITIGIIFFGLELLLMALFTLGPETTEELHDEVKYWLISDETRILLMLIINLQINRKYSWRWITLIVNNYSNRIISI